MAFAGIGVVEWFACEQAPTVRDRRLGVLVGSPASRLLRGCWRIGRSLLAGEEGGGYDSVGR